MSASAHSFQTGLFDHGTPEVDSDFRSARRRELGFGAFIDWVPGWVSGHQELMRELLETTQFRAYQRVMFDRVIDVPRLTASLPEDGPLPPVVERMRGALNRRYAGELDAMRLPPARRKLTRVGLAYYRNGQDSVAPHGDKMGELRGHCIIAVVSLGAPRRFTMKPVQGGRGFALTPGWGDLIVMGGTCQDTFLHGVPKVAHAEPRMSIQFRPDAPDV